MNSLSAFKLIVVATALLLQGCAFQQWKINNIADQLRGGSAQQALLAMQGIEPPKRDQAQYLLNLGMLKHLNGNLPGSTQDLQGAKDLMAQLQAVSVREVIGATTVNETLRSYIGTPSERVLVQQLLALNYLAQGDLDGARVEMLQSGVLMRAVASKDSLSGQVASAYFITGLIYELGGERDDALIAYRHTAELIDERGQALPRALQDSLLSFTQQLGFKDEYQQYVQRFGREAVSVSAGQAEVVALYWQGVVSAKKQSKISVFAPNLGHHISLAVPSYADFYAAPNTSLLSVGAQQRSTELLDDIEVLAREDLQLEMPKITATTLLRAVAKHQAVKKAREGGQQNGGATLFGFIADVASVLTEVADVRSWNTLPSNIQVARLRVPAGEHPVNLGRPRAATDIKMIKLHPKQTAVLLAHGVSDELFVYTTQ